MDSLKIGKSLWWVGVLDKDLRVFDIIMRTEFGTTYNSYVMKGSEKVALFETAKAKFADDYLSRVSQIVDIKKIDYVVMNHTEPDHSGTLEKIIDLNPSVKVVGTAAAINFLKQIVNRDFYSVTIKEGTEISLGDKTLQFFSMPNLHWPDSMYTWCPEEAALFTCDSFGSHYAFDGIVRSKVADYDGYIRATKYYFDNILGPFSHPYMDNGLAKARELKPALICTGHGPVHDSHIDELFATYEKWLAVAPKDNEFRHVAMPYVSAYGYTKILADEIKRGVEDSGAIKVEQFDLVTSDKADVMAAIGDADGLLFGSPTILSEALSPIWDLLISMFPGVHGGKFASAFGSFGWSGEAVPHIIERLKQLKMKVTDEGYRIRFKPSKTELLGAYEFGYAFGCKMLKKENDRLVVKNSGLVKCLVCGEVFSSDLKVCPVCGVGPENFVPVDDASSSFSKDTDEKFVVIGGGTAAFNAAEAIRKRNKTASVTLISEEPEIPYNRPMLTKNMIAGLETNAFAIQPYSWFMDNKVDTVLATKVASIDTKAKKVVDEKGEAYPYDKLIYAAGAYCFVPPIPGADGKNVLTIRKIEDIEKLSEMIKAGAKSVAVIGGGVLGLEGAWELNKAHLDVTVIETAPRLLPRALDANASELLKKLVVSTGTKVVENAKVEKIDSDGVQLADGTKVNGDIVVISTGVRPNISLAKDAGIPVNRGVVVNNKCETGVPGIYAAGDCAEFNGVVGGIWPIAVEMGKVAGAAASGEDLFYTPELNGMSMHAFNTSLYAVGDTGTNPDKEYKTVESKDIQRGIIKKCFFENGKLVGAVLLGETDLMANLTDAIKMGKSFADIFGSILK